jgi:hypothetical protein
MDLKLRKANLCHAIELSYTSLRTHFLHAIEPPKKYNPIVGTAHHSAKAMREYAEIILICAVELEYLTNITNKPKKPKKPK